MVLKANLCAAGFRDLPLRHLVAITAGAGSSSEGQFLQLVVSQMRPLPRAWGKITFAYRVMLFILAENNE